MFDQLKSYHPNINLPIEVNPSKFLDTKLTKINGTYKFNIYLRNTKLPSSWTTKTPKRYKRITINGDLHCSKRISSNSDEEIPLIKDKFMKADYTLHFINSVVNESQKGKKCGDESFIIPASLFEIAKRLIFVEIPYCELNEIKSKHFLKKVHKFTNNSFRMVITWKTRNIRSLFRLKDKNDYKSCVIYKGDRSSDLGYIDETKRNAEVRWSEHNNPTKSSEPSKHLRSNINHYLHGLSFQMLQKMLRPGRTLKHHILLSGNLILMSKRTLKDWFYLEMVSHRAIDSIMQTPKKEVHFFFFSVVLFLIALDN